MCELVAPPQRIYAGDDMGFGEGVDGGHGQVGGFDQPQQIAVGVVEPGFGEVVGDELGARFEGMGYRGCDVCHFETKVVVAQVVGVPLWLGCGEGVEELPEFDGQIGPFDPARDDSHVTKCQYFVVAGMGTDGLAAGTVAIEQALIKITEAHDIASSKCHVGQPRDLVGGGVGHSFELEDVGVAVVYIDITMTGIEIDGGRIGVVAVGEERVKASSDVGRLDADVADARRINGGRSMYGMGAGLDAYKAIGGVEPGRQMVVAGDGQAGSGKKGDCLIEIAYIDADMMDAYNHNAPWKG